MDWALQAAKNRFSEVVRRARREGPQTVTVRGQPVAIVLSVADYEALIRARLSLVDNLLSGPGWDDALADSVDSRGRRLSCAEFSSCAPPPESSRALS
jgi:prevent-host-death family protein